MKILSFLALSLLALSTLSIAQNAADDDKPALLKWEQDYLNSGDLVELTFSGVNVVSGVRLTVLSPGADEVVLGV